jgi:hypothetical protein
VVILFIIYIMEIYMSRSTTATATTATTTAAPKMTQNTKILNFLRSGASISAGQARGLFGVTSLGKRVSELRSDGYAIYTNVAKNGATVYRLGTPSRAMVAAAYQVAGSSVFE